MVIKLGDIIEFKGRGTVYGVMSRLIKVFEWWWDRWGWHTAFICGKDERGWLICEAVYGGVQVGYLRGEYKVHRWFDEPPSQEEVDKYVEEVLGADYDVAIYFWTTLQYLIRHLFNHRIPRLLNDRYTCWELVWWFCRGMGKPIQSIYDCPMITDLLKAVGESTG